MPAKDRKPKLDIKKALTKAGISQYRLAQMMGIEGSRLPKMMKPDYNPTFKTLVRISECLNCQVSDLIDE